MTRLILIATVFMLVSGPVGAENTKTMECENYVISNGIKDKRVFFLIRHIVGSDRVEIKVTSNNNSVYPPVSKAWQVLWKSEDSLRIVAALIRDPRENSWVSPATLIDIDYRKVRYKQVGMGGLLDLDIVSSPWKQECRRSD